MISMKDVLFDLATSYKLMNPIRGMVPESPLGINSQPEIEDDIDRKIEAENSQWMTRQQSM